MWSSSESRFLQQVLVLKQLEAGRLIRALRQLIQLTQEQFAGVLGVTYSTLNRWENDYMQLSPLALKQVHAVIDQLKHSPSQALRDSSVALLSQSFAEQEP